MKDPSPAPIEKREEKARVESSLPDKPPVLRAAYQRFMEGRGPSPGPHCPEPEELLALAEGRSSEKDRLRVMEHVAQCHRCREDFDLLRAVAGAKPSRKVPVRPWMAVAASVAVLFGAGYGVWRGLDGVGSPVLRGPDSSVELMTPPPGEEASRETEFRWQPSTDAYEYVFEILNLDGESLYTDTTSETSYLMDLELHPELDGTVQWWVTARLGDGSERHSETRPLDVSRP